MNECQLAIFGGITFLLLMNTLFLGFIVQDDFKKSRKKKVVYLEIAEKPQKKVKR